jgi:ABC-type multidrug transport system fused ATPase/permease subunit
VLILGLLRTSLRPYARAVTLVVLLLIIQSIANLYLPNLNADIINNGVVKGDVNYIWVTGGIMLGISVALGIISVIAMYWASRVSMGVGRDLRTTLFERVQLFSVRDMNRFGTASLITRNTNDVQQIQLFLQMALTVMVMAPIMGIGGVIMALYEDVSLSLVLVVVVPLMAIVVVVMLALAVPLFQSMQVKIDRINRVLREQITGIRVIRAFVRTRQEQQRFEMANADLTMTALRVNRIFVLAMPVLMVIMNLSSVAVLWFGGHLIDSGTLPIGNLTAFLSYILQILLAVMMGVMVFILVPRAVVSAARIQEVVHTEPSVTDPTEPATPRAQGGVVEFRDATFGYSGGQRPVLRGVSFVLQPGETAAIVGGTGAGKTTLLNLIPRLFDVTSGAVVVDGVDVREQSLETLWDGIGLVPQRAYLFGGTVAGNLRFGRADATDAELWHALEVAQAREFVESMPGRLDAVIDQGGTNVSGGQRQRLAIARAIVKRPAVYLFDDCFSALDAGTDNRLRGALKAEAARSTVVIVAQRVSTIMHAEQIIVLEDGRVVGIGAHDQLITGCTQYREIVASQLGEEAAA